MILDHRKMTVYADGDEIGRKLRKTLVGRSTMTLLPDFYTLEISGLSDGDIRKVKYSKNIRVVGEDKSLLFSGSLEDLYTHYSEMSELTTMSLSDGMGFWEQFTNTSVGKGASVRSTIMTALGSAPLGSYLAGDARLMRGQALVGKSADIVSMLAASVNARAYFTQSQVHIVSAGMASSIVDIKDKDIVSTPEYANGVCTLRMKVKGWPVGLMATVSGKKKQYRLVAQTIMADSWEGPWETELTLIDESILSANGMVGG